MTEFLGVNVSKIVFLRLRGTAGVPKGTLRMTRLNKNARFVKLVPKNRHYLMELVLLYECVLNAQETQKLRFLGGLDSFLQPLILT